MNPLPNPFSRGFNSPGSRIRGRAFLCRFIPAKFPCRSLASLRINSGGPAAGPAPQGAASWPVRRPAKVGLNPCFRDKKFPGENPGEGADGRFPACHPDHSFASNIHLSHWSKILLPAPHGLPLPPPRRSRGPGPLSFPAPEGSCPPPSWASPKTGRFRTGRESGFCTLPRPACRLPRTRRAFRPGLRLLLGRSCGPNPASKFCPNIARYTSFPP
ncbi:hypothetical protein Cdeb_00240 [Caldibacillus debilis GB1]|uniref:Uncharacterized protein n=1 Tax=Caldibacillus debilis GB1 TaxID=1339248 RepID=A0A420VHM6_9BACI|nr:hypothetical protein Cdeb_00240 [Caldibacillus debilis GB1]